MKKLAMVLVFAIMLACSAHAYSTIVSVTINDIRCQPCNNGDALTKIEGDKVSGGIFISTRPDCLYVVDDANRDSQTYIEEGLSYTSDEVSLASGSSYYFCMQITEFREQVTPYSLPHCAVTGNDNWALTLWPATVRCPGATVNSRVAFGTPQVKDTITFAFPFIA